VELDEEQLFELKAAFESGDFEKVKAVVVDICDEYGQEKYDEGSNDASVE